MKLKVYKKVNLKIQIWIIMVIAALMLSTPVFSVFAPEEDRPLQSDDWLYYDEGDHISVCGYLGKEKHIIIPSSIGGKEVTAVSGNRAIIDQYGAEEPNGFFRTQEQENIKPVTKHITIPDTVKIIDDYAFNMCMELEQVDMPQGLTEIGDFAFEICEKLTKADIPEGTERIGYGAYYHTGITRLNIPDTVKYIESAAFGHCTELESVKLPAGLTEIPLHMFTGCTSLKSIEIPDTVKDIGERAFWHCSQLESIKLSKGIKEIPKNLFDSCSALKSIVIPEGVRKIGENAFYGCTALEEIYFPSTLTGAYEIISLNSSLKNIYFDSYKETVEAIIGTDIINNIMAPTDYVTDYSNVQIHYKEKEIPTEKTIHDTIKDILKITAIIFTSTFLIGLCLTIIQKAKLKPKKAEQQGNALTDYFTADIKKCKHCGAGSGKEASYCYNCGKKLK